MSQQETPFTYMTDALERQLIEQELRAQAQQAAAKAVARGVKRFLSALNAVLVDATELQARERNKSLRSA